VVALSRYAIFTVYVYEFRDSLHEEFTSFIHEGLNISCQHCV
jgi:hypothetical protein